MPFDHKVAFMFNKQNENEREKKRDVIHDIAGFRSATS